MHDDLSVYLAGCTGGAFGDGTLNKAMFMVTDRATEAPKGSTVTPCSHSHKQATEGI